MRRPLTIGSLLIAAGLVLGACGDDGNHDAATDARTGTTSTAGATDDGPVTVDISDFTYVPSTVSVPSGTEVTFTNSDSQAHTATADGAFDTESIAAGDEATVTVEGSGEVTYICSFHPFMKGTIVVE